MENDERRKNTRVEFHTIASARFGDEVYDQLEIKDLSLKGVYLLGVARPAVGERCDVSLSLAGTSSELKLNMQGEVVRRDSEGVGIYFVEVDIDTFFHLKNIVYYNAENPDLIKDDFLDTSLPDGTFE